MYGRFHNICSIFTSVCRIHLRILILVANISTFVRPSFTWSWWSPWGQYVQRFQNDRRRIWWYHLCGGACIIVDAHAAQRRGKRAWDVVTQLGSRQADGTGCRGVGKCIHSLRHMSLKRHNGCCRSFGSPKWATLCCSGVTGQSISGGHKKKRPGTPHTVMHGNARARLVEWCFLFLGLALPFALQFSSSLTWTAHIAVD